MRRLYLFFLGGAAASQDAQRRSWQTSVMLPNSAADGRAGTSRPRIATRTARFWSIPLNYRAATTTGGPIPRAHNLRKVLSRASWSGHLANP